MLEVNLPSDFETLWMEICAYINPKVMNEEIDTEGVKVKDLKKYADRIFILNEALKKIQKYELYFSEFYPTCREITSEEVLDHHMHAYLADITILRHAMVSLINTLKKDVQKIAKNKEEMRNFFEKCEKVTFERFDNATQYRNLHAHAQTRFLDEDNVRSGGIKTMLKIMKQYPEKMKEGAEEYLQEEAEAAFQKSKEKRCKMAKDNAENLTKLVQALFVSLKDPIYRYLKIKPILREKLHAL